MIRIYNVPDTFRTNVDNFDYGSCGVRRCNVWQNSNFLFSYGEPCRNHLFKLHLPDFHLSTFFHTSLVFITRYSICLCSARVMVICRHPCPCLNHFNLLKVLDLTNTEYVHNNTET